MRHRIYDGLENIVEILGLAASTRCEAQRAVTLLRLNADGQKDMACSLGTGWPDREK